MRRIEGIKCALEGGGGERGRGPRRRADCSSEASPSARSSPRVAEAEFPSALLAAARRSEAEEERAWLTLAALGPRRARQVLAWRASELLDPAELAARALERRRSARRQFRRRGRRCCEPGCRCRLAASRPPGRRGAAGDGARPTALAAATAAAVWAEVASRRARAAPALASASCPVRNREEVVAIALKTIGEAARFFLTRHWVRTAFGPYAVSTSEVRPGAYETRVTWGEEGPEVEHSAARPRLRPRARHGQSRGDLRTGRGGVSGSCGHQARPRPPHEFNTRTPAVSAASMIEKES